MSQSLCYSPGMKTKRTIPAALIGPNLDPKSFPKQRLFEWIAQPRNPVLSSNDPLLKMFIRGMLAGKKVDFIYVGGSTPGLPRSVHVSLVFQHEPHGRVYIAGYCPERAANRVYALDLIMVIHAWN